MDMKTTITINFSEDDVKRIIAEYVNGRYPCKVKPEDVRVDVGSRLQGYGPGEYSETYLKGCSVTFKEPEAYWKYWGGWKGNHDQRIEDATCSRCGYKHPTVRGSVKLLADVCPKCNSRMDKYFGEDK